MHITAIGIVRDFCGLLIALCIGIYTFPRLSGAYRVLLLQVIVAVAMQLAGLFILYYQSISPLHHLDNRWLFNYYITVETSLLSWFAILYINDKRHNRYLLGGYVLFSLVFLIQVIKNGINIFANWAAIAEGVFFVIVYFYILYSASKKYAVNIFLTPEFWLCIGSILYFGCYAPFIGVMNYLIRTNSVLTLKLFDIIRVLENIRYLCVGISFLLYKRMYTIHK